MYAHLFSPITIQGLTLKNRLTMAPLYLGYAGQGGTVSDMLLDHYRLMAKSGVAMVVVENATVDHPAGSGSNRTLRADTDDNLDGLKRLAEAIKQEGYMLDLATAVRTAVDVPIIAAGRFATGGFAERAIAEGKTDIVGLARVLWADPLWPQKVRDGSEGEITHCNPDCGDACMHMVMKGRPFVWPGRPKK
jgi:2,4-dienoyl-CoA reductase-like NADH-dependent reductase (Old Yellow Enzyme family)